VIDITLTKAKYRRIDRRWQPQDAQSATTPERRGVPEGTWTWNAKNGGPYKGRDVSNGPGAYKRYTKRHKEGTGNRRRSAFGNAGFTTRRGK
jgi:hypothetical protein